MTPVFFGEGVLRVLECRYRKARLSRLTKNPQSVARSEWACCQKQIAAKYTGIGQGKGEALLLIFFRDFPGFDQHQEQHKIIKAVAKDARQKIACRDK